MYENYFHFDLLNNEDIYLKYEFVNHELNLEQVVKEIKMIGASKKAIEICEWDKNVLYVYFNSFDDLFIFKEKVKQAPFYTYTDHYQCLIEQSEFIAEMLDDHTFYNMDHLLALFDHSRSVIRSHVLSHSYHSREYWYELLTLLHLKWIQLKIVPLPYYPTAELTRDQMFELRNSYSLKSNMRIDVGFITWNIKNHLKEIGENNPRYSYIENELNGEQLDITIKMANNYPENVVRRVMDGATYIHIPPTGETPYMYWFIPTDKSREFNYLKLRDNLQFQEAFCLVIQNEEKREREKAIIREKKKAEQMRLKAEKERNYQEVYCNLINHDDEKTFSLRELVDIMKYDPTSPFKDKQPTVSTIQKWLRTNKMNGILVDGKWNVSKLDIQDMFYSKSK